MEVFIFHDYVHVEKYIKSPHKRKAIITFKGSTKAPKWQYSIHHDQPHVSTSKG
jgi:hypothetical protein